MKILTVHTGQIGENLLLTPAFRALRNAYPSGHLAHLTSSTTAPIFSGNPDLTEVIPLNKSMGFFRYLAFLYGLRKKGYDVAVDFLGNPRTALLVFMTGAPIRIGFDYRVRKYCYSHAVRRKREAIYIADYNMALLAPLGVDGDGRGLTLVVPAAAGKKAGEFVSSLQPGGPIVTISPVSRRWYKRWPEERFSLLADVLVQTYGARIVFLWGPGEEEVVRRISGAMRGKSVVAPKTTLMEMAGIIARADVHIGNDNGPMHMAVAVGTPSVTVYGPTDPRAWCPPPGADTHPQEADRSPMNIVVKKDAGCSRCRPRQCRDLRCFDIIGVNDVFQAASSLLRTTGKIIAH